jgi:hypothetical protein
MSRRIRFLAATFALVGTAVLVQPTQPTGAAEPPTVANTQLTFDDVVVGAAENRSVYVYNYDAAPQMITSSAGSPTDPHFTVADGCNGVNLAVVPNPGY